MREGGGEAPKREARTKRAPIGEVERPLIVDLIVRVGAKIDAGRELQPAGRLDEDLVADEQIADGALAIVRRLLREQEHAAVGEAALRERLSVDDGERPQNGGDRE